MPTRRRPHDPGDRRRCRAGVVRIRLRGRLGARSVARRARNPRACLPARYQQRPRRRGRQEVRPRRERGRDRGDRCGPGALLRARAQRDGPVPIGDAGHRIDQSEGVRRRYRRQHLGRLDLLPLARPRPGLRGARAQRGRCRTECAVAGTRGAPAAGADRAHHAGRLDRRTRIHTGIGGRTGQQLAAAERPHRFPVAQQRMRRTTHRRPRSRQLERHQ